MNHVVERTTSKPKSTSVGTDAFYRQNAHSYFERTFGVPMEHLYRPFLEELGEGARILDVGCGSGRDVKAFRSMGFHAFGIDPSPELLELAVANVGPYFTGGRAETFKTDAPFDAVWACASLLHLRRGQLHSALRNLRDSLRPGGVFFATVQVGVGEHVQSDGRQYTYYGPAEFVDAFSESGLQVLRSWETGDAMRSDGPRWINVLARR